MEFSQGQNKIFLLVFVFIISAVYCAAQNVPRTGRIAILSFNGGSLDERDGIAELFSFTPQMMTNFTVIPRTTITSAIAREQSFQISSGMTDADTMARLGVQFGADYVMAGSITSLGSSNLLIVSIVKIDVIQQIAGDFLIYNSLDDLNKDPTIINKMAEKLVLMMKTDSGFMDKLAVLPVQFTGDVNERDGDALAQLLSIYLIRNRKYSVYPRTRTLEQVQDEYATQLSGITREEEAVSLGRGINPPYVLSIHSRRIGSTNRFNASVIDLEGGHQIAGLSEPYTTLTDGIAAMEFLAKELSGIKVSEKERAQRSNVILNAEDEEQRQIAAGQAAKQRQAAADKFLRNSGFNLGGLLAFGLSNKSSDDSNSGSSESEKTSVSGGGTIELRLSPYFGLETGIMAFKINNEIITSTLIQLPILARLNLLFMGTYNLSPYIGMGINLSNIYDENAFIADQISNSSFMVGAEFGMSLANLNLFLGYLYNADISDNTILNKASGIKHVYKNQISYIYLGLGWFIPFRSN